MQTKIAYCYSQTHIASLSDLQMHRKSCGVRCLFLFCSLICFHQQVSVAQEVEISWEAGIGLGRSDNVLQSCQTVRSWANIGRWLLECLDQWISELF